MSRPFRMIDSALAGTVAASVGLDRAAGDGLPSEAVPALARLVNLSLFEVTWGSTAAVVTVTDAMALSASAVLLVRFVAWVFSPFLRRPCPFCGRPR